MRSLFNFFIALLLLAAAPVGALHAEDREPRLALVIGNAHYKTAPLATAVNDAGLVAQALREAGFDVTEGADLGEEALRNALRDFVAKVQQAGPGAVVFVYLAGRGLQYAGENYFVPVDAVVERETDVPIADVRLSDYTHALIAMPAKARIFVFDGARGLHFATEGFPFASGFALVNPEPGSLYAVNAAPSTIAPDESGPYGVYAQALVEMMRQGAPIAQLFVDTRLRANQISAGAVVPWDVSKIEAPVFFFTRDANAPPLPNIASIDNRPISQFPAPEAYTIAVLHDTIEGYQDFLTAFPRDPLSLRVQALLAARREALTWRRALDANTPAAYWTYMRRYPHGPHFFDARRRLSVLAAALDPPPRFDPYDFEGLPPPTEAESAIVDRPVLIFNDPAFPPPPAPPDFLLPMRPVEFEHLLAPLPAVPGSLPVPAPISLQFSKPAVSKIGAIAEPSSGSGMVTAPEKPETSPGKPSLSEGKSAAPPQKPTLTGEAKPTKPMAPEAAKPKPSKQATREAKPPPEEKEKPGLKQTEREKAQSKTTEHKPEGRKPPASAKPRGRSKPVAERLKSKKKKHKH